MEKNSEQPTISFTAILRKADINGSHKTSLSELGKILKALGPKTGEEELKRMMSELDTGGDGYVDIHEFKVTFCGGGDNTELKDVCNMDRKRKFLASELQSMLKDIGEEFSLKDCRGMLRSVDVDGYGFIDLKEVKEKFGRPSSSCD